MGGTSARRIWREFHQHVSKDRDSSSLKKAGKLYPHDQKGRRMFTAGRKWVVRCNVLVEHGEKFNRLFTLSKNGRSLSAGVKKEMSVSARQRYTAVFPHVKKGIEHVHAPLKRVRNGVFSIGTSKLKRWLPSCQKRETSPIATVLIIRAAVCSLY